jgi:hypothetical protein
MKGDRILLIGRGWNGWHASGLTGSGNAFSSSGGTLEGYIAQSTEGCAVYDASEADETAFAHMVISGPMVSHTVTKDEGTGSFDYISVDSYMALLREKVPGIKIGYVTLAGCVRWENT